MSAASGLNSVQAGLIVEETADGLRLSGLN